MRDRGGAKTTRHALRGALIRAGERFARLEAKAQLFFATRVGRAGASEPRRARTLLVPHHIAGGRPRRARCALRADDGRGASKH